MFSLKNISDFTTAIKQEFHPEPMDELYKAMFDNPTKLDAALNDYFKGDQEKIDRSIAAIIIEISTFPECTRPVNGLSYRQALNSIMKGHGITTIV